MFQSRVPSPITLHPSPRLILIGALSLGLAGLARGDSGSLAESTRPATIPRFFTYFGLDPNAVDTMADRYAVVVWHDDPTNRATVADMKQRSPQVTAFMYRDLFCVLKHETPLKESVGRYDWIESHHPDWFQQDTLGRRIEVPDYPWQWMMDLGNPDWQAFWIEHTLQDVMDGGWDGVFADDALTTIRAHQLPPLKGYSDDAALQRAVYEFLVKAATAFHRAGKLLTANVSGSYDYPGLWERWLLVTDGLMEEHFAGEGWTWGDHVAARQLEAMQLADRTGKWMLCMTYGPLSDQARMQTSLAAYLIGAGPKIVWSYRPSEAPDETPWHPSWNVSLGEPLGLPNASGALWMREFTRGSVAVNVGRGAIKVRVESQSVRIPGRSGVLFNNIAPHHSSNQDG